MAIKNSIVFVSNSDRGTASMLERFGFTTTFDYTADGITVACFTGGADICPIHYGQKMHKTTSFCLTRDLEEIRAWKYFAEQKYNMAKIGICRGMQLGNVMLGGSLYQDIDNHDSVKEHSIQITNPKGSRFAKVNSCHHQMVIPPNDMRVLAYADEATHFSNDVASKKVGKGSWSDVEAIYHPYTNFLGVQWHPEWTHKGAFEVFEEMVYEHLTF